MLDRSVLVDRADVPDDLLDFFEPAECGHCYVCEMVTVFREVRRVLRDDGTLWLNLGDSYASSGMRGDTRSGFNQRWYGSGSPAKNEQAHLHVPAQHVPDGLKPKDLTGIPWRVAFALQADGWYLRSDIIWHKPNPMPESVRDRPTKSHEYLFLLSKQPRYFFDAEAVKEPHTAAPFGGLDKGYAPSAKDPHLTSQSAIREGNGRMGNPEGGRNIRSVWTIATAPFAEAHFATFPPALVEPCIKAGTSEKGACAACGAPWVRVVERVDQGWDGSRYGERAIEATGGAKTGGTARSTLGSSNGKLVGQSQTTGWQPACTCNAGDPVPCVVLDPFGGAGTVGLVADRLGRDAILIEISPEYAAMARRRITGDAPMFADVEVS